MKLNKKFMLLGVAGVAALGLASCGGNYTMVWCADAIVDLTNQQIAKFKEENPDVKLNFKVEAVGEGDAASQMITDVTKGADIFCFAQDQLARLVEARALGELGTTAAAAVKEANDDSSVKAATVGGKLYAYPLTSDNGYFMYYDKSVVKAEHLDDLASILADCEAAGKKFNMQLESAWYNASFFFATGCESTWVSDATGKFTSMTDTYKSAQGLISLKGMKIITDSAAYNKSDKGASEFKAAVPSAVVISGTWDSATAKEALGDNLGVAKLPCFKVDGTTYQMGSFSGNKLLGVKPQTDPEKAVVLSKLAQYLSGAVCQEARFDEQGWGPSNKTVQAKDKVKNDVVLAAFAAQNTYATPQGQYPSAWWDIGGALGKSVAEKAVNEFQGILDTYDAAVKELVGTDGSGFDLANAQFVSVIGKFGTYDWNTDVDMENLGKNADGSYTFITKEAITFAEGDEFKVRFNHKWAVSWGKDGANFTISAADAGAKYVKIVITDKETAVITLQASK